MISLISFIIPSSCVVETFERPVTTSTCPHTTNSIWKSSQMHRIGPYPQPLHLAMCVDFLQSKKHAKTSFPRHSRHPIVLNVLLSLLSKKMFQPDLPSLSPIPRSRRSRDLASIDRLKKLLTSATTTTTTTTRSSLKSSLALHSVT